LLLTGKPAAVRRADYGPEGGVPVGSLSMPIGISPKVPVENSPHRCAICLY
jgi:hypothetical protein